MDSENYYSEFRKLDKQLENYYRLCIMAELVKNQQKTFKELRDLLQMTDGNLASHTSKLEKAGYIWIHKFFAGRIPKTSFTITPFGKRAFKNHKEVLDRLLNMKSTLGSGY